MGGKGFLKGALGGVIAGVVILVLLVGAPSWSQGFLGQTSSATGGQQGAQNQAAQSSISIESVSLRSGTITIVVRNVGAVPVSVGSITVFTGITSNSEFRAKILATIPPAGPVSIVASDGSAWTIMPSDGSSYHNIPRGTSVTLTLSGPTPFAPNDLLSVKVATTVGTFAQSQFTVQ